MKEIDSRVNGEEEPSERLPDVDPVQGNNVRTCLGIIKEDVKIVVYLDRFLSKRSYRSVQNPV